MSLRVPRGVYTLVVSSRIDPHHRDGATTRSSAQLCRIAVNGTWHKKTPHSPDLGDGRRARASDTFYFATFLGEALGGGAAEEAGGAAGADEHRDPQAGRAAGDGQAATAAPSLSHLSFRTPLLRLLLLFGGRDVTPGLDFGQHAGENLRQLGLRLGGFVWVHGSDEVQQLPSPRRSVQAALSLGLDASSLKLGARSLQLGSRQVELPF